MAEGMTKVYRAALECAGPDGEDCTGAIAGLCTDNGTERTFAWELEACPSCGRRDGFTVRIFEEVAP